MSGLQRDPSSLDNLQGQTGDELTVGKILFRVLWRSANVALVVAVLAVVYSASWEYSIRRYLDGFTDAITPAYATPEQQVESILYWMRNGPQRSSDPTPSGLAIRDPEATLNFKQLLSVCGTATNAFLNLARSSGLQTRRLLLLTPDRQTKHVVAEVLLNGRWVVIDPTYRVIMRNAKGETLTRKELQNPQLFAEAIAMVPGYPATYSYEIFAHVRMARLPLDGMRLRPLLDRILPGWDERFDWSLLLERESFLALAMTTLATILLLLFRALLAWYADQRLHLRRFRLRSLLVRAGSALFTTPEIK